MPTYRNDSTSTYQVKNSEYQKQVVPPGESVSTLQLLELSGMTKTSDDPANPKVWNLTVSVGTTYADNVVDVGAVMTAKSGYIRTTSKVNMRFNSLTGDTVVFDVVRVGYVWTFGPDDTVIDKIYFENPASSGAVDITIEVFTSSI